MRTKNKRVQSENEHDKERCKFTCLQKSLLSMWNIVSVEFKGQVCSQTGLKLESQYTVGGVNRNNSNCTSICHNSKLYWCLVNAPASSPSTDISKMIMYTLPPCLHLLSSWHYPMSLHMTRSYRPSPSVLVHWKWSNTGGSEGLGKS